ncbi:hypothetical protein [Streptosporangium sp. NPDC006930]|uniref:hypothetical protein n=1 Tax=unclassified Streptosporangium TaxID=2632669 RepID=UPI00344A7CB9
MVRQLCVCDTLPVDITTGLEITDTPHDLVTQFGEGGTTARYVHVGDNRFVGVEPDEGPHPLIAFLQDERFLYDMRAVPRVTGQGARRRRSGPLGRPAGGRGPRPDCPLQLSAPEADPNPKVVSVSR